MGIIDITKRVWPNQSHKLSPWFLLYFCNFTNPEEKMTSLVLFKNYVAEVRIPSSFYTTSRVRNTLPNPEAFEILRAYWKLDPMKDPYDEGGYAEFTLVIEFPEVNLRKAEEKALNVANQIATIASAYGGFPITTPSLFRIATVTQGGTIENQHNYVYRNRPYLHSKFNNEVKAQLEYYLEQASSITHRDQYRLSSAIYWYGTSIGAPHPTVSYVAAWTGLETIAPLINERFHPGSLKSTCRICNNKAGKKRNGKIAAIQHLSELLTGHLSSSIPKDTRHKIVNDLKLGLSPQAAQELRDNTVHGLRDLDTLYEDCSKFKGHLTHLLNAAIQIVLGKSARSELPGDYEHHPDVRMSLSLERFPMKPFLGQWVELRTDGFSKTSAELSQPHIDQALVLPQNMFTDITGDSQPIVERFTREPNSYHVPPLPNVSDSINWADRPLEPPW